MPRPRRRGWTAVRRMTASTSAVRAPDWRWGFESRRPPSFQRGAHARVPAGRFQLRPLTRFRDGRRGQPDGGDGCAGVRPGGQVARHGEGLRWQGSEARLAAPVVEQTPLSPVDPVGVVGENGLQGVGHALVCGAQGRQVLGPGGGRSAGRRWWSWTCLRRRDFSGDFGSQKMRDKLNYRAANGCAQPAASDLLSGFRRTENLSLQRFVRSGAARELPAVPVTALSNVTVSPTANRLVSIPMVFIPIHCNGPRHAMDLVMECIGMECIGVHSIPMHSMTCPRAGGPGKRMKKPGAFSLQYW